MKQSCKALIFQWADVEWGLSKFLPKVFVFRSFSYFFFFCHQVVVDGTGEKKEANGELDKSDCNGHNKTDETVALGAKKASGGSRIAAFFGKLFKPRSDLVADKSATEEQTVVKMVDEEGLEQTVVEETTSLTKEAELDLEDKYITLDKPEPVEEDDNKKEPTPNTSF